MNFPRFIFHAGFVAACIACPGALLADTPAPSPTPAGKAEHVIIMVWDGLRPDSVNDTDTPTLAKLAREGVTFTRHHPVYPSLTEVNGTAMATGCYPGHSGLIGNVEYRAGIHPLKPVSTENPNTIHRGDELTGGHYLRVPTLPELVHAVGGRTAVAGTKPVALLWDRADRPGTDGPAGESGRAVGGKVLPPTAAGGEPFPAEVHFPNTDQDRWTTRTLLDTLWKDGPPKFSVLWMSDPDYTQHQFGPNSEQARRALAGDDANLAAVLAALDAGHWRDRTDVFVVSDHGFSTIGHRLDTAEVLAAAGFHAVREFRSPPQPGDVLVDGLSGAVFLYVAGHDQDTIRRLVEFCQRSEFAGVIFTREKMPGTFSLDTLHVDSPDAPDVLLTMRWSDAKNATGFPGEIYSDGGRRPGQGTHATLGRFDMHNTLVASGPDFRQKFRDDLPSSNADLAPTVAHLLGLPHPPMDGRILTEALAARADAPAPPVTFECLQTHSAEVGVRWGQYLQVTRCGGETYFDEGNAMFPAPSATPTPASP